MGGQPLPGEVPIAKDQVVSHFERLEVFVWLEKGARYEGDGDTDDHRDEERGVHAGCAGKEARELMYTTERFKRRLAMAIRKRAPFIAFVRRGPRDSAR